MALMSTHRLTNKQAKLLRDSEVPILVHIAEKDVIVKPKEQAALADLLQAQVRAPLSAVKRKLQKMKNKWACFSASVGFEPGT